MRTLPLLPPARPTHITVHPHKPMLVVACQGAQGTWDLRCIHAVTGEFYLPLASCECSRACTHTCLPWLVSTNWVGCHKPWVETLGSFMGQRLQEDAYDRQYAVFKTTLPKKAPLSPPLPILLVLPLFTFLVNRGKTSIP